MKISHGDTLAFEQLYTAHFARVRDFLRIYLGDASADDLAQHTFLQFWRRPNGFNPARSDLKAYLFGIARKKAADWWRHRKPIENSGTGVALNSSDSAVLIGDALKRLDPEVRNILWLREVEGYSYDELAAILDVPLGTVRSRLFAAREQLRRVWKTGE